MNDRKASSATARSGPNFPYPVAKRDLLGLPRDNAYARGRELISVKALLVRSLARQLLTSKVMTGDEIVALFLDADGVDPAPVPNRSINSGRIY